MPILDQNGRLFGRVNLVDGAALVAALLLLPIGVATCRVFRVPRPEILKIDPETVRSDGDRRLRVEGRNLRPYMRAFLAPAGQPVAFVDLPTNPNEATLLIERPTLAELRLPDVAPGSYDLYLYDEGREVARRLSAFTVAALDARPAVTPDAAVIDVAVRFDIVEAVASLIKAGDLDVSLRSPWPLKPATVQSVRRMAEPPDRGMSLLLLNTGAVAAVMADPRVRLEALVRAGVMKNHGVWEYEGRRRMRAGEAFVLATSSYVANGLITRVTVVPGVAPENVANVANVANAADRRLGQ